jgi:alanyl-tRNA synthetase
MEKYGLNELREKYLSFFETKGHLRLPSFSLIPQHDPSLLLINAGMSPMKTWFTGEQEPPRHRVTTCQKCIRTPDIENIGKTARHGTYFEMLGNFSFGDYFKKEAISWAWEFLTSPEWIGLDPNRLYPSVYQDDDEAWNLWHEMIGIPADRIFRFGKEDNFWEHGSGPCGPCSEIYYDRGEAYGCGKPTCTVGCDCDRYIEVWNLVFTQFNNDGQNNYTPLSQKNIDTGMGLERLAVVCQEVNSLFDVDTVMNITHKVSEITGATYGQSYEKDVSLRIITDHIRSSTFMICDGVLPSNEGRGYVLRRLLRRAARHGRLLGVTEPFLYQVCDMVVHENMGAYPELKERQAYITRVIRTEEESFARTIDTGLRIFSDYLEGFKKDGVKQFSGDAAFKLHDTYGFPIDLTEEMAEEQGFTVDRERFNACLQEQKDRARAARGDMSEAWKSIELGLDNTPTVFTGYETMKDAGRILAIVEDGELSSLLGNGKEGIIVLDRTPFYAEKGGQIGDKGILRLADGSCFEVTDTQLSKGDKVLHHGICRSGAFRVDDTVSAEVDEENRKAIMRAHSATHLLQASLRQVLGDHVQQAGSLVTPDLLRFDFTHYAAITPEELRKIEELVNAQILNDLPVTVREMPIDEARKEGAMALFGEKYGNVVRVVSMGDYSKEFCGGTHLSNTAKIGSFHLISEASIASGVRRVEAVTGKKVLEALKEAEQRGHEAAEELKTTPAELSNKARTVMNELKDSMRLVEKLQNKLISGEVDRFLREGKEIDGLKLVLQNVGAVQTDWLRSAGDQLRDKAENVVAVLAAENGEKITFLAVCGKKSVAAGVKAGELVKLVTGITGGSGGGKPDSAMGGGKDASKLSEAMAAVELKLKEIAAAKG